jgi:ribosomal protein S18 acetylase RimI-like enzyme
MNEGVVIRNYIESDREPLQRILKNEASYTTKRNGGGSEKKKECLCYMYCDYYFDFEPENVFVAVDNGEPCGFIVGSTDWNLFSSKMNEIYIPKINKNCKLWGAFHKLCVAVNKKQDNAGGVAFHINIDHNHQGKKIGTKLMTCMFENAAKKGKKFLYLVTMNSKTAGYAFYKKLGFDVVKRYPGGSLMMKKNV